jgi:hypothetical protein
MYLQVQTISSISIDFQDSPVGSLVYNSPRNQPDNTAHTLADEIRSEPL